MWPNHTGTRERQSPGSRQQDQNTTSPAVNKSQKGFRARNGPFAMVSAESCADPDTVASLDKPRTTIDTKLSHLLITILTLCARTFSGVVSHHALAGSLRLDSKAALMPQIGHCAKKTLHSRACHLAVMARSKWVGHGETKQTMEIGQSS